VKSKTPRSVVRRNERERNRVKQVNRNQRSPRRIPRLRDLMVL